MIREKGRPWRIIRAGILLAAVFALSPATFPETASADALAPATLRGACDVAFLVTSTLHDVPGSGRCLPFEAVLARDAAGRQVIPSVEVEVPVRGWTRGTRSRDGQMREMFRSDRFPRIHAAAQRCGCRATPGGNGKGSRGERLHRPAPPDPGGGTEGPRHGEQSEGVRRSGHLRPRVPRVARGVRSESPFRPRNHPGRRQGLRQGHLHPDRFPIPLRGIRS